MKNAMLLSRSKRRGEENPTHNERLDISPQHEGSDLHSGVEGGREGGNEPENSDNRNNIFKSESLCIRNCF